MTDCQCLQRGSINLIIGPMFSGKTTELFRMAQRHTLAGRKVAIVKYAHDTRYDVTHACTHDARKMEALSATTLAEVQVELEKYDVVGIDEGQFFKDIVKYAKMMADVGKTVIIAALNGNYRQEPFPNVATLIPFAEKIEKLSAVCRCGQSASFTFRMSECTKLEMIGGQELYRALCRTCVNEHRRMKEQLIELKNTVCAGAGPKRGGGVVGTRMGISMKRAASGPLLGILGGNGDGDGPTANKYHRALKENDCTA